MGLNISLCINVPSLMAKTATVQPASLLPSCSTPFHGSRHYGRERERVLWTNGAPSISFYGDFQEDFVVFKQCV